MAKIDYLAIENKIKELIEANSDTSSYTVLVEPADELRTEYCPYVAIYLDSYESPSADELIGGTKPVRTFLNISVWCYDFSLDNLEGASARDTMLANVKEVLKSNRDLGEEVLVTRFTGGSFDNQKNIEGLGFFKGVSIGLQCEVRE